MEEDGGGGAGWGWATWRVAAVAAAAVWVAMHVAARMADALWWRPRRLEAHFAAQGVRGPPYRFLLGSVREMVALMAEASSKPMSPPTSHNARPRGLAFYHYWRKIYGEFFAPASAAAMCARGAARRALWTCGGVAVDGFLVASAARSVPSSPCSLCVVSACGQSSQLLSLSCQLSSGYGFLSFSFLAPPLMMEVFELGPWIDGVGVCCRA